MFVKADKSEMGPEKGGGQEEGCKAGASARTTCLTDEVPVHCATRATERVTVQLRLGTLY